MKTCYQEAISTIETFNNLFIDWQYNPFATDYVDVFIMNPMEELAARAENYKRLKLRAQRQLTMLFRDYNLPGPSHPYGTKAIRRHFAGEVRAFIKKPTMSLLVFLFNQLEERYHIFNVHRMPTKLATAHHRMLGNYSSSDLPKGWRNENVLPANVLLQYMPHPSKSDATRLAYVQTFEKLVRDPEPLFTVTAPGKFLSMINSKHTLGLSDDTLRQLAEEWIAFTKPVSHHILNNNDPKWVGNGAALAAEWVRLYREVTVDYSCMRRNPNGAVATYGRPGNNIGLVYWEAGDGTLISRAVINVETKTNSRAYPSISSHSQGLTENTCYEKLKDLGYENNWDTTMDGVHLNLRYNDDDQLVCPYIDGETSVTPYSTYLKVFSDRSSGEYGAQNTDVYGLAESQVERVTCEHCGTRYDEDSDYIRHMDSGDYVCEDCLEEHYVWAYTSSRRPNSHEEYILREDAIEVGGDWYLNNRDVRAINDIVQCVGCDEYFLIDDTRATPDGCRCSDCCVELSSEFYSDTDYQHADPDDTTETEAGETILEDDAVEIDGKTYHKDEEVTMTAEEFENLIRAARRQAQLAVTTTSVTTTSVSTTADRLADAA